jgi:hypothetical protein
LAGEEIISGYESSRVFLLLDLRMNQGNSDCWLPFIIHHPPELRDVVRQYALTLADYAMQFHE